MSTSLPKSAYYIRNDAITLIQGSDSTEVLERLVTTKISDMQDLTRRDALFCDYNGRICDMASIYTISSSILLSSSDSVSGETRRKLVDGRSWDEECEILVADNAIFRITVFPDEYGDSVKMFGVEIEGLSADALLEKDDHLFVKNATPDGIFFDILVKFENLDGVLSTLRKNEYDEMDQKVWNNARMMLGLREICDSKGQLPNEIGLGSLVSNDKGCYPGQEIHARLESRGRKIKTLCRITGDYPIKLGKYNTSNFGTVSISSAMHLDGEAIAFALIRLGGDSAESVEIDGKKYIIEILGYP